MKRTVLWVVGLLALFCAAQAWAETAPKHPPTAQQMRMKNCAAEYHQKKIRKSDYRTFMRGCLRKHPIKTPPISAKTIPAPVQTPIAPAVRVEELPKQ